jgi:hypothetical protein
MTPVDDPDTAAFEDPEYPESGCIRERAPEPDNASTRSYRQREQRARFGAIHWARLLASRRRRIGWISSEPAEADSAAQQ